MLKMLSTQSFPSLPMVSSVKCAEIFCQNSDDVIIFCVFCHFKFFEFKEFLSHLKNMHLQEHLLNADCKENKANVIKCLNAKMENDEGSGGDDGDGDGDSDADEFPPENQEDEERVLYEFSESSNVDWHDVTIQLTEQTQNEHQKILMAPSIESSPSLISFHQKSPLKERSFEEKPEVVQHTLQYTCEYCEKRFFNKGNLNAHMQIKHISHLKPLICDCCTETFISQNKLDAHQIAVHNGIPCPECERRYKGRRELLRHIPIHTGVKNYICDFQNCSKRFYTKYNLNNHRKKHTETKKYICENCGYSCWTASNLRVHIRTHTGERPHTCKICGKGFPSHSALSTHQSVHSTERPYKCDVCGKTFAAQKSLYHHKPLHSDVKKFVCSKCGMAYAQAAGLAAHMRKHKEKQP